MSDLLTFVVLGLATGSIYGLAGTGLVLTYSTSGVFNFAHGAVAALGAYAFYELVDRHGLPWPLALALCLGVGGVVMGLMLEALTRRLQDVELHFQVAATVGLVLVAQDLMTTRFGYEAHFVKDFLPTRTFVVLGARVGVNQLLLLAVGAGAAMGVQAMLRSTRQGIAVRAVVDNPALLGQTGTAPAAVRRRAWMIGSAFAVGSGILLAPTIGLEPLLLTFLVVQAFGAAALGRFSNLGLTYAGGLVVGVAAALATRYLATVGGLAGLPASVPFIVLYVALVLTPPRQTARQRPTPSVRARTRRPLRPHAAAGLLLAFGALVAATPTLVGARLPVYTNAAAFSLVFLSLALLVNQSGQVSLCHGAFCAVGAATFAHLSAGAGLPWAVALLGAGLAAVPLGALVALPTARLSPISLAMATFGLAILAQRLLYPSVVMFGATGARAATRPGVLGLGSDRGYFYVVAAVACVAAIGVTGLARSRQGRLLRSMADDSVALGTLGASLAVTRVVVFCMSAFLAAVGGGLMAGTNESVSAVPFAPLQSLLWVAVLVVAGRGTVAPAVRAAIGFAIIPVYLEPVVGGHVPLLFGTPAIAAALVRSHPGAVQAWFDTAAARFAWRSAKSPIQARTA